MTSKVASFQIPGRLPSLNQSTRWERTPRHRFWGARKRAMAKILVGGCIRAARVQPFKTKVHIKVRWIEKDRRRDYDNIASGIKVILDALKACDVIVNDSQKWLEPVTHEFEIDKKDPRIEVTITEAVDHEFAEYPIRLPTESIR